MCMFPFSSFYSFIFNPLIYPLASQIPCTPNHLYKVYANATINTGLLQHISDILDYNFFEEYT